MPIPREQIENYVKPTEDKVEVLQTEMIDVKTDVTNLNGRVTNLEPTIATGVVALGQAAVLEIASTYTNNYSLPKTKLAVNQAINEGEVTKATIVARAFQILA